MGLSRTHFLHTHPKTFRGIRHGDPLELKSAHCEHRPAISAQKTVEFRGVDFQPGYTVRGHRSGLRGSKYHQGDLGEKLKIAARVTRRANRGCGHETAGGLRRTWRIAEQTC